MYITEYTRIMRQTTTNPIKRLRSPGQLLIWLALPVLFGCTDQDNRLGGSCLDCHQVHMDASHQLACTVCHKGNEQEKDQAKSHSGLIAKPAHPEYMNESCGSCHEVETSAITDSSHFTLRNKINKVREHFGADTGLKTASDIPQMDKPESILNLADDMLRRNCLSCHLTYEGDDYPATHRGTGCAACHMSYDNGQLTEHTLSARVTDNQCLSCHYGNYVGFDYYGRFEHDLNVEYRTPYFENDPNRDFGVEYHQLAADIHQQKGLMCIDCHSGAYLMGLDTSRISCSDCHDAGQLATELPLNVMGNSDNTFSLLSATGNSHPLPLMSHPAHENWNSQVHCQVCHARWSFNDKETHLLRTDTDNYDDWDRLTVQGSSEVERYLEHNLVFENEELEPTMQDKITGSSKSGIWFKGYLERRWEGVRLGRDDRGRIAVMRPILNLSLSWIDEDDEVIFDAYLVEDKPAMLPYTPHTTGAAGLFYEDRIRDYLQKEESEFADSND